MTVTAACKDPLIVAKYTYDAFPHQRSYRFDLEPTEAFHQGGKYVNISSSNKPDECNKEIWVYHSDVDVCMEASLMVKVVDFKDCIKGLLADVLLGPNKYVLHS